MDKEKKELYEANREIAYLKKELESLRLHKFTLDEEQKIVQEFSGAMPSPAIPIEKIEAHNTGSALRQSARNANLSNKQIAEQLNINEATVSRHMNNKVELNRVDAVRYAKVLGTYPERLLFPPRKIPVFGNITRQGYVEPIVAGQQAEFIEWYSPAPSTWFAVVGQEGEFTAEVFKGVEDVRCKVRTVFIFDIRAVQQKIVQRLCAKKLSLISCNGQVNIGYIERNKPLTDEQVDFLKLKSNETPIYEVLKLILENLKTNNEKYKNLELFSSFGTFNIRDAFLDKNDKQDQVLTWATPILFTIHQDYSELNQPPDDIWSPKKLSQLDQWIGS